MDEGRLDYRENGEGLSPIRRYSVESGTNNLHKTTKEELMVTLNTETNALQRRLWVTRTPFRRIRTATGEIYGPVPNRSKQNDSDVRYTNLRIRSKVMYKTTRYGHRTGKKKQQLDDETRSEIDGQKSPS
jgi:hypothetical protein